MNAIFLVNDIYKDNTNEIMKTLKERNTAFDIENKANEMRLKLIALDRRLRHLNRSTARNWIEGLGMRLQRIGIRMQIRGVLIRMKNSK